MALEVGIDVEIENVERLKEELEKLRTEVIETAKQSLDPDPEMLNQIKDLQKQIRESEAKIFYETSGQNINNIRRVSEEIEGQGAAISKAVDEVQYKMLQVTAMFGIGGFSLMGFISRVKDIRGQFQKLEKSFNVLLGNEERANDLMQQLTRTAATTPFDLQGVAGAARQLLAYGVEADKVNEKIVQLGNIASGVGEDISTISFLYGSTIAKDYADSLDMKQFQSRGIAIKEAIGQVMGLSKANGAINEQVDKLIRQHKVTSDVMEQAIMSLAGEGGKFAGMMEQQSQTIAGQISNIQDAIQSAYNEIGKRSEGYYVSALEKVSWIIENYKEVAKVLGGVAAAYGGYKAALMAINAFQRTNYEESKKALEDFMAAFDKQHDAEMEQAIERGVLSEQEAKRLITLKEQAKEQQLAELQKIEDKKEELRQTLELAKAEEREAELSSSPEILAGYDKKLESLNEQIKGQQEALALAKSELEVKRQAYEEAARLDPDSLDAKQKKTEFLKQQMEVRRRESELEAKQNDLNTASEARNTAARDVNEAAMRRQTATERRQTVETQVNTEMTALNTRAANLAAMGEQKLTFWTKLRTMAQKGLNFVLQQTGLIMLKNPYVLIAAAVAGVVYGIIKLITYETDLEKAQKKVNEAFADGEQGAVSEITKFNLLTEKLRNAKEGTQEYENAKKQIIDQFGKYHEGLDKEIDKLKVEKQLQEEITAAIIQNAMAKSKETAIQQASDDFGKAYKEQAKEVREVLNELKEEELEEAGGDMKLKADIEAKYSNAIQAITEAMAKGNIGLAAKTHELTRTIKKEVDGQIVEVVESLDIDQSIQDKLKDTGAFTIENVHNRLQSVVRRSREAKAILDASIDEANKIYESKTGNKAAEAQVVAELEKTKDEAMQRYRGLADLIERINEGENRVRELREKARHGGKKTISKGGKSVEVFITDEDIKNAEKEANELKAIYKTITEIDYDGRAKAAKAVADARKALVTLQEEQRKAEEAARLKREDEMAELEDKKEEDSMTKRLEARERANAREIREIEKEGEDRAKAVIEAQKKVWEAEQKIAIEEAKRRGQTQKVKRLELETFDEEGAKQSDAYKKVQDETQEKVVLTKEVQEKTNADAFKKDLKEREEYYNKALEIEENYRKRKKEIDNLSQDENLALNSEEMQQLYQEAEASRNQQLEEAGFMESNGEMKQRFAQTLQEVQQIAMAVVSNNMHEMLEQLEFIESKLQEAKGNADGGERTAQLQAQVNVLKQRIRDATKAKDEAPGKKAIKQWQRYKGAAQASLEVLGDIGDELDEDTKKAIDTAKAIAENTMNLIDNITTLAESSMKATQGTATATSEAIKGVERASVILAIIGAALQIIQKLSGLIKTNDQKFEEANTKQQEINAIAQAVRDYETEVEKAQRAEKKWFSSTGLRDISDTFADGKKALENYYAKANEIQVKYQNKEGGGFLKKLAQVGSYPMVALTKATDKVIGRITDSNVKFLTRTTEAFNKLDPTGAVGENLAEWSSQQAKAIDNLVIETRAAKKGFLKGRSQQTQDLRTWVKDQWGKELFDEDGMIDEKLAQKIIDTQGDKLQGNTQETLESLIEYKKEWQEAMKSIEEYVSSMYSPVVDNMTDALMNWLDTGEDVMDSFKEYASDTFRSIAQEMVKTMVQEQVFGTYQEDLKKLYKQYANKEIDITYLSSESARLTKDVMNRFNEQKEGLKDITKTISDTYKQIGVDITGAAEKQEATYGGYETMSEDTGQELSGRFTALYLVGANIDKNITTLTNDTFQTIITTMVAQKNVADEIRNILALSYVELQSINDYTAKSYRMMEVERTLLERIRQAADTLL